MKVKDMHPRDLIQRYLIIDLMREIPIALIEQLIVQEKITGDFIEEFDEEGSDTPVKRLNYEWLFFEATNFQLDSIGKNIIKVPAGQKHKQKQSSIVGLDGKPLEMEEQEAVIPESTQILTADVEEVTKDQAEEV